MYGQTKNDIAELLRFAIEKAFFQAPVQLDLEHHYVTAYPLPPFTISAWKRGKRPPVLLCAPIHFDHRLTLNLKTLNLNPYTLNSRLHTTKPNA
jgi:hypothetical protein